MKTKFNYQIDIIKKKKNMILTNIKIKCWKPLNKLFITELKKKKK